MAYRHSPPLKPILGSRYEDTRSHAFPYRRYLYVAGLILTLYLWYTSSLHILPHQAPIHAPSIIYKNVDWSRYAYALYATETAYLCNALMIFSSLATFGSRADRVLFYPSTWDLDIDSGTDRDSQLLVKARDELRVKLLPVEDTVGIEFRAWELSQYDRLLAIDGDTTVLKEMDALFLAPKAKVGMVRKYEGFPENRELMSGFVLLEPEEVAFQRLMVEARKAAKRMEALNQLYRDSAMVLSHRTFGLSTQEFRAKDHTKFLGNDLEEWDPERIMRDASFIRFEDEPLPKPWILWPHELIDKILPRCKVGQLGDDDCRDKKIWTDLYDDFRMRRRVCTFLTMKD